VKKSEVLRAESVANQFMATKSHTLFIKNMVCRRCVMTVEGILDKLHIDDAKVSLGEVELSKKLPDEQLKAFQHELSKVGFDLIDKRINKIVEEIKLAVLEYISLGMDAENNKLTSFNTKKYHNDYIYLSDVLCSIE
jgi:copper chaperone CopZ